MEKKYSQKVEIEATDSFVDNEENGLSKVSIGFSGEISSIVQKENIIEVFLLLPKEHMDNYISSIVVTDINGKDDE